jgi:hypothetical protein
MVVTHLLRNGPGKKTSRFLVLAITVLVTFVIIPSYSIQKAHAAEITLAWDQNSEPDIAGYRIYYGRVSRSYTNVVDVGNYTSCVIADLEDGQTYYFAATAYNTDGYESGYSNEITNGEDGGDTGATSGGCGGGGGGSCFINAAVCGFPVAKLKKSALYCLSKIKHLIQFNFHDRLYN